MGQKTESDLSRDPVADRILAWLDSMTAGKPASAKERSRLAEATAAKEAGAALADHADVMSAAQRERSAP